MTLNLGSSNGITTSVVFENNNETDTQFTFGYSPNCEYGYAEGCEYGASETSRGVHTITLSRELANGEYVILNWENGNRVKIEKKDNVVHVYRSYGGVFLEIGKSGANDKTEVGYYTFNDIPNRPDSTFVTDKFKETL